MPLLDRKTLQILFTALVFAVVLLLLWNLKHLFFLMILALFLAYTMEPLIYQVQRLAPKAISRNVAVVVIYVSVLAIVGLALTWLGQMVAEQASALIARLPAAAKDPARISELPLPAQLEPYREEMLRFVLDLAQGVGKNLLSGIGSLGLALLVPIFAIYYLIDGRAIADTAIEFSAGFGAAQSTRKLLDDLHDLLSKYIRAVLFLSLSVFIAYSIFYSVAGTPYALLLATLAALFEIIPVVGWISAAGISVFIAVFSGYPHWGWMLIFYIVFRLFQDYVVTPYLMAHGIELNPLLVLAGVIGGEMIGGIPGMFLSLPVIATLRILYKHLWHSTVEADEAII